MNSNTHKIHYDCLNARIFQILAFFAHYSLSMIANNYQIHIHKNQNLPPTIYYAKKTKIFLEKLKRREITQL